MVTLICFGRSREREEANKETHLFEIRQYACFVRLRAEHVIPSVTDGGGRVKLLLLIKGKGKESCRSVENGLLQCARNTVASDLKEAGADAGGPDLGNDALGSWAVGVRQKRSNVNGWHLEISRRGASRSHGCVASRQ